ncbi:locomotion-related protein Hikaru genki-like [Strongylocentrotus purpuratus]|uniref:Uncharacterized protein n=1 Tax=Strongylocentrotus purpuratus TaxID=7668 RepID=A0A7M7SVE8_STRPU|nr:locomotion-related protein Hikaru genki-like [Strongylocentrotus purpuratus]
MNRLPLLLPILALLMVIRSPVVHGVTVGADFLDVRLVNGSNNASGRVEVWYNGTWGTVCDDGWDLNDANVVCRMLGFFDASSAPGLAAYGAGSGKIHLDEVECTGSESSLEDCIESEFGVHNCDHSEDAGVTCGDSPAFQPHIWIPKTRIEKPCLVPRNRGPVLQFVNGDETRPITSYYTLPTLPDGTKLVARCRDPGMYRLIGDQRRTCQGGQWTGEEPECQPVKTQVLFYGASHEVASNGTVVVYVHRGNPSYLDVVCYITSLWLRPPRLTTPLVNGGDLWNWPWFLTDAKRLNPISTDFSGIYTCNGSSSFHSVHVLFKAAECEAPEAPEHGRLLDGSRQEPRDIFPAGTTVSFECEDDYSLVGSMEITCEKGQWSDDPPVCTVSKCPVLNIPDHVVTESVHFSDGRNIGDERIFNCVEGYVLQGDTNNLRCLESGVWSAPLPTCEAAECEALQLQSTGGYWMVQDSRLEISFQMVQQFHSNAKMTTAWWDIGKSHVKRVNGRMILPYVE